MKNKTSQTIFAYWNEIRGPRMAPRRFEIEPARISGILPETFILERQVDGTFRFRLAGTQICELYKREFRGADVVELFDADDRFSFERVLRTTTFEGAVAQVEFQAQDGRSRSLTGEMVLLPLFHVGDTVTRILGTLSFEESPAWFGVQPLRSNSLDVVSLIWPDGRPHAVIERGAKQPPFTTGPFHKRVVTRENRSFRVFDGGLADDATLENADRRI